MSAFSRTAQVTAECHIICDAAVAAFESVVADLRVGAVARCGHRLEHIDMVTTDQVAKLGASGLASSACK
ncbi:hypothetical protein [Mycobacterium lepromatosis]|uniref:hypothetical protein n=1 Tax=Mycobacterium lepromatosis TaxID=480418 RepID=UPI000B2A8C8B|nr:hypothetical protein [Mycobacterium lepromatosis]